MHRLAFMTDEMAQGRKRMRSGLTRMYEEVRNEDERRRYAPGAM